MSSNKKSKTEAKETTVFVGNLSFNADEDTIASAFADAGEVVSVRIITDAQTGKKKGGDIDFDALAFFDTSNAHASDDRNKHEIGQNGLYIHGRKE